MKTIFQFLTISIFIILCSCNAKNKQQVTAETVTITHSLGTTEVPKNPERVVVLDFGVLENLSVIGIKPVAIPKNGLPKYLSQYGTDPSITDVGNLVEVSLEKINEVKPDLIILGGRLRSMYDEMSKIAPTICPMADYNNFFDMFYENISNLSKIFGDSEDLNKALVELKNKVDMVKAKTSVINDKALIILHNKGKFSAYGSGSRFGIIHDTFGIKEVHSGLGTHQHGNPVSSEFIQQANPDILFIVDRSAVVSNDALDKKQIENKLVQQTNAYKNGKIIYLDPEAWYLSGGSGIISMNIMIDEIERAL